MGRTQRDRPALTTSVFMVLELEHDRGPNPGISAVVSVPGREGTFTKKWKTIQGRLDDPQVRDLLGYVQMSAHNSLVAWTGTQSVLPME